MNSGTTRLKDGTIGRGQTPERPVASCDDRLMPSPPRGVSIRLFLADGSPDGLWVVEKSNWTGLGLVLPRTGYAQTRTRDELSRPGVYVLVGPSESVADRVQPYRCYHDGGRRVSCNGRLRIGSGTLCFSSVLLVKQSTTRARLTVAMNSPRYQRSLSNFAPHRSAHDLSMLMKGSVSPK